MTQNGYLPTEPFKAVVGPVYRMLADLGEPGARGGSSPRAVRPSRLPHYDDMIEGWRTGRRTPSTSRTTSCARPAARTPLRLDPITEVASRRDQIKLTRGGGGFLAEERVLNVATLGRTAGRT